MKEFGFQWHLLDRCNQKCSHCYQDSFSAGTAEDFQLARQAAKNIFEALPDAKVSVNLTGGEPFLLPWLGDLVEYLGGFSNLDEIFVITNGSLSGGEPLHNRLGSGRICGLKISLESGDEGVNDAVRGKGNFKRVGENLEDFIGRGYRIILMMTLAKYNAHTIAKTVDWARSRGIREIIFERFVPLGVGESLKHQTLDSKDWWNAAEEIAGAAGICADPLELAPYRAFWLDTSGDGESRLRAALCNLGESMALMPDGTVFPCRRLPTPIGNILTESFLSILTRLGEFAPDAIKRRLSGSHCRKCDIPHCSGCRALASALCGDSLGDDPQCFKPMI